MTIILPDLPYRYDALAPVISETTMRFHHDKHHARYVEVGNLLLADKVPRPTDLEGIVRHAARAGEVKLFNNAAQAWNHGFFWACMSPNPAGPRGDLERTILEVFGDVADLKTAFVTEGINHFGSGWVWLVAKAGGLAVLSTHDAETVITQEGVTPLLVCDLWEHAYYLDHQNNRAAFLSSWWDGLVNWDFVEGQYAAAKGENEGWRYPEVEGKAEDKLRVNQAR
ncbi:superoxide dismutase [Phenylobacterium sp.]|uniref:superoxide dismutase n=1 Tax=Phenylobacterium sp. TaxID=1871053 RepID=UPI003BACD16B